jgi:hypothetical protein
MPQYYKSFSVQNFQMAIISKSISLWQALMVQCKARAYLSEAPFTLGYL